MVNAHCYSLCVLVSYVFLSSSQEIENKSSIDAVRLELLRQLWSEPPSYKDSGSNLPHEWKAMFQPIIDSNDVQNLKNNQKREKLLDHISVRTSILLNYLPDDIEWTEKSNVSISELSNYRIVFDESWNNEFSKECLTVGSIIDELETPLEDTNKVLSSDEETKKSSHKERMLKLKDSLLIDWPKIIIAIKDKISGDVTILDGNHRAVLLLANEINHSRQQMTVDDDDTRSCNDEVDSKLMVKTRVFMGYINRMDENEEKTWKFWRDC